MSARLRAAFGVALAGVAAASAVAGLLAQAPGAHDEARAAWRYRRAVLLPGGGPADGRFVGIPIPPEVAEHSQPGLRDLRLVADDGREVPFVLDVDVPRTIERRRSGRLVEAQHERRLVSAWIVDFGTSAPFDRLELDIDGAEFSKRVTLDTSDDGAKWTPVPGEAWVFDRPWRGRQLHDTAIERATPIVARYVRIAIDDWRSRPVVVRGATAVLTSHLGGRRWTRDVPLVKLDTPAGSPSRYRVDAPAGLPIERLTIAADDAAFWRDARVLEETPGRAAEAVSGAATIYRLRLDDPDLDAEQRDIDLARPAGGSLVVEIADGDSPPLTRPRVTLSGVERRALASPPPGGTLTLYYGNAVTRRPVYDIEALRTRLSFAAGYPEAALGAETANPRFVPLAPMAFLPARGAEAETRQWSMARSLVIPDGDDIYTLTLEPADLAHLRPDLADIRIVDADRRQVPYVLEARAEAARVPLAVSAGTARGNAPRTSASVLRVSAAGTPGTDAAVLPLAGVSLQFKEAFYSRPAVVLIPDARAAHGQRVVTNLTLDARRRDDGSGPRAHIVELGDLRTEVLGLEVSDGDNAPLTLTTAEATVWVPRLTFKASGGAYRVLLGNREAGAPTYDLAALRQDILAYSASPLDREALKPLAANADYNRSPGDLVQGLAKGPWMWGALALSIVALLWLTRTILKTPPPSPPSAG